MTPDQLRGSVLRDHVGFIVLTPDREIPESASFHASVAALERGGLLEPVVVPGVVCGVSRASRYCCRSAGPGVRRERGRPPDLPTPPRRMWVAKPLFGCQPLWPGGAATPADVNGATQFSPGGWIHVGTLREVGQYSVEKDHSAGAVCGDSLRQSIFAVQNSEALPANAGGRGR